MAIHSAPPRGVFSTEFSFLKSSWKSLLPTLKPYRMSFDDSQYAFTNGLPLGVQEAAYRQLLVPESRRVMRGLLTGVAAIDFTKPHPPLLFTAGNNDPFIPSSLNHSNYEKYKDNSSTTDFAMFLKKDALCSWSERLARSGRPHPLVAARALTTCLKKKALPQNSISICVSNEPAPGLFRQTFAIALFTAIYLRRAWLCSVARALNTRYRIRRAMAWEFITSLLARASS